MIVHPDEGKVIYSFRFRDQIGKLWRISFTIHFTRMNALFLRLQHYAGNEVSLLNGVIVAKMTQVIERGQRSGKERDGTTDDDLDGADAGGADRAEPQADPGDRGPLVHHPGDAG